MWFRLRIKQITPIHVGIAFAIIHSIEVLIIVWMTLRKVEFAILWHYIYRNDYPISLLLEVYESIWTILFKTIGWQYLAESFILCNASFYVVFGGMQCFLKGYVIARLVKLLWQKLSNRGNSDQLK